MQGRHVGTPGERLVRARVVLYIFSLVWLFWGWFGLMARVGRGGKSLLQSGNLLLGGPFLRAVRAGLRPVNDPL